MSFQALNAALSGLRVAQQQLTVISNNVSNATTPGYTRKILPQTTQVIDSTGDIIGVQSETMIRKVDMNLEKELWTQVSSVSELSTKATYLDTIEKFHGVTNKESSIAAEIADLKDSFSALSDSPSDGFLQQATLAQAQTVAQKLNDFGKLITDQRNNAQDEMEETVNRINTLLESIANLNSQIKGAANLSRSTAGLEDHRDEAIKELSGLIGITSFSRGDGVLVIQTVTGVQLTDERPTEVFFNPSVIGPSTTYPGSVAGIYVGGDPAKNPRAVDITPTNVSGKLGALIDLRDNTLVQYQAQADEVAHKLAVRMDAQGLRLFTDQTGAVPSDAPPDLSTNPPTPVAYVGFATIIRVNQNIVNDVSLIQQGTYNSDVSIPTASNEVIRRVIEFGFGETNYQQATGTTDLNLTAPATDLQQWLGLYSRNNVVGGIDLASFAQIDDAAAGGNDIADQLQEFFPNWPNDDSFRITLEEPRLGLGPVNFDIDLSDAGTNFPIGSPGVNNALDQIIAEINSQITAAALPAGLTTTATKNTNGQLSIQSRANVQLSATGFTNAMTATGFGALGFTEASYTTEDPYFDIQVGTGELYRITVEPGETVTDLVAKLEFNPLTQTGVPGLYVDYDAVAGTISLRPGMDDTNGGPNFGGDIRIISGPGTTTGAVNPVLAALPAGVGLVSALFGSYTVNGTSVLESSPIQNVAYQSETYAGSGVYVGFRRNFLGPEANMNSDILTDGSIIDFGQKMVNAQAQDVIENASAQGDATSLHDLLSERFLNETGVNIDEELSTLIVIQTAYAAAARAVTAADEMFQELLNSI
ncbi:MAG: flagellar hook-associated protein FlgK [Micavibrio aeruginosavorus]|uniref:Flagellar hook-associated protein 1 n=1 Tax=Micavibrio aeruginosavorus TaxID=349221 RepID=A0A2W5NEE1_9BACT|nr:MAG: flagellar hook-associated protein FlgK [Micavibrio aeruginosavorus]